MDHYEQGHYEQQGGRYVVFAYCISLVVITFKRYSDPIYIAEGESALVKGLPYTLLTLVFGWWGFPFGPIFSLTSLYTNLIKGGEEA